jgi:hypothetical protein
MNRHERRAAQRERRAEQATKVKGKGVVFLDWGTLLPGDPNYAQPVNCYLCAAPHAARDFVRIENKSKTDFFALCGACFKARDRGDTGVLRKYLAAPDIEIIEGGEATTEQVLAIAEKQDVTEH